jgi:hypothetical protein
VKWLISPRYNCELCQGDRENTPTGPLTGGSNAIQNLVISELFQRDGSRLPPDGSRAFYAASPISGSRSPKDDSRPGDCNNEQQLRNVARRRPLTSTKSHCLGTEIAHLSCAASDESRPHEHRPIAAHARCPDHAWADYGANQRVPTARAAMICGIGDDISFGRSITPRVAGVRVPY